MDSSFASNDDFFSQIGFILCLRDDSTNFIYLIYQAESHAGLLTRAWEVSFMHLQTLLRLFFAKISDIFIALGRNTRLRIFTESK